MFFFSIWWVGIERWSPPLVLWLCIKGGGQGICLQFQADSKPYQSQVLLVIMCSCNSSNSAPCSCSCFAKVNGKSPASSRCCCIKQWEATGHERPELVSVVEGVLTTMREKFPMDLDVLKLETDSMKHPRRDLQRNGSPKRNQTWRIPKKSTKCTEEDTKSQGDHIPAQDPWGSMLHAQYQTKLREWWKGQVWQSKVNSLGKLDHPCI